MGAVAVVVVLASVADAVVVVPVAASVSAVATRTKKGVDEEGGIVEREPALLALVNGGGKG